MAIIAYVENLKESSGNLTDLMTVCKVQDTKSTYKNQPHFCMFVMNNKLEFFLKVPFKHHLKTENT